MKSRIIPGQKSPLRSPVTALLAIWCIYLAFLGGLQLLGLGYGFKVWHIGEDLNWIAFMLDGSGSDIAQQLWRTDGRNPLSPWWYIAVERVIRASPYGLHVVSLLVNPFLSVSTYLLLDRLGRGQSRFFAFSVALVIIFWSFTGRFDHIQWNMFGAMGCALLSIFFYCRHIDEERRNSRNIVLSLLLYFVAIASYTLQSGAIVAVLLLALLRDKSPLTVRRAQAAFDVAAFLCMFGLFDLIWATTTPLPPSAFFSFDWGLFVRQLGLSLSQFFFHPIMMVHWNDVTVAWRPLRIVAIFAVAFMSMYAVVRLSASQLTGGVQKSVYGWALVILMSLGLPILVLEATSSLWVPGSRSIMVQPVFQPILLVALAFAIASALGQRWEGRAAIALTSLIAAATIVLGLGYNHRQVLLTKSQMGLAQALRQMPIPAGAPITFVVKYADYYQPYIATEPDWGPMIKTYSRSVFGRPDVQVRPIKCGDPRGPDEACAAGAITFVDGGADIAGVRVPESQLRVVLYAFGKVVQISEPHEADFEHLCVIWKRSAISEGKKAP